VELHQESKNINCHILYKFVVNIDERLYIGSSIQSKNCNMQS
jgi:hypothetical protein